MRLLLDENLPKRLKLDFADHEVYTVLEKGWNGFQNGKLLQAMLEDDFHALLTFDKNLQHQQNFNKYLITVFVLSAKRNTCGELTKFTRLIQHYLKQETLPVGAIVIQSEPPNM